MSLRKKLIRLAHSKPELRKDLLPLLKTTAFKASPFDRRGGSPDQRQWTPPPVSRVDVPEDADEWGMYSSMAGANRAAKSLTKVMKNALVSVGKNVTPHKTDAANARALQKIRERVDKARYKRDDYGAGDTEGRVIMLDTFEEYIKLYLDEWDFPMTFEVLGG